MFLTLRHIHLLRNLLPRMRAIQHPHTSSPACGGGERWGVPPAFGGVAQPQSPNKK